MIFILCFVYNRIQNEKGSSENNPTSVIINLRYTQNIILRFDKLNGTEVASKTKSAVPGTDTLKLLKVEPAGTYFFFVFSEATVTKIKVIKFLKSK